MKRILATTALVLIMAGGAYSAQMGNYTAQPQDVEASDFIGARIYAAETLPTTDTVAAGAEKDWDDVGEINDVILGRDGQIKAVVLGVGGFLGMGEKSVAIPMQDVKFVKNGDGPNDYFLVVNANKDVLTNAPAYVSLEEKAAQQTAANDAAAPADTMTLPTDTATDTTTAKPADTTAAETTTTPADNTTAADTTKPADTNTAADATAEKPADTTASATTPTDQKPADTAMNTDATTATPTDDAAATDTTTTASTTTDNATQAMTDENRTRLVRPEVNRDGYKAAEVAELTADKLEGARVYGPNDEDVGEVNRLILDNNRQVQRIVLDVGGFLGMGERQIAVTPDELNIVRTDDGNEFRVYVDSNQANLKAQPEYKG
jgi:sporulation protein YlmC with PRC-barrel domain